MILYYLQLSGNNNILQKREHIQSTEDELCKSSACLWESHPALFDASIPCPMSEPQPAPTSLPAAVQDSSEALTAPLSAGRLSATERPSLTAFLFPLPCILLTVLLSCGLRASELPQQGRRRSKEEERGLCRHRRIGTYRCTPVRLRAISPFFWTWHNATP